MTVLIQQPQRSFRSPFHITPAGLPLYTANSTENIPVNQGILTTNHTTHFPWIRTFPHFVFRRLEKIMADESVV